MENLLGMIAKDLHVIKDILLVVFVGVVMHQVLMIIAYFKQNL